MLDWSGSALTALWFAIKKPAEKKKAAAVRILTYEPKDLMREDERELPLKVKRTVVIDRDTSRAASRLRTAGSHCTAITTAKRLHQHLFRWIRTATTGVACASSQSRLVHLVRYAFSSPRRGLILPCCFLISAESQTW